MDEPGNTTQDLRPRTIPAASPRPAGRRTFTAGLILGGAIYPLCLTAAVASEGGSIFNSRPGQLFAVLSVMSLIALALGLVIAGHNARQLQRQLEPLQARIAEHATAVDGNRILLERLTDELRSRDNMVMGHIEAVPHRVSRLEDDHAHVKGELVKVGNALEALAQKLPDELLAEHWRGFNEAVREGFAEKTGTDNHPRRPPWIGLVPDKPNEPGE